jgi:tetratricopeptide (TPR) repeat protein
MMTVAEAVLTQPEILSDAIPDTPYRGLDSYTEETRDFFFGRDEESTTIAANLLTSPVTVLYGASGVGKSSVLMAGVIPFLRDQQSSTVVLFRKWQEPDLIPALNRTVAAAVMQRGLPAADITRGFDICVASAVANTNGPVTIILDQFDEFLLYHGPQTESGAAFEHQFSRLVNRGDAPVNFLISIREDWVAKLDRFQSRIPNVLSNLIRLEHLDLAAARTATTQPLAHYNRLLQRRDPDAQPYSIEPALVETILDQVKTAEPDEVQIETAFLQMILSALWEAEAAKRSRALRLETLGELGGAERIVRDYVDREVRRLTPRQQEVCALIFDRLVTPSGSKIAHTADDLQKMIEDDTVSVQAILTSLGTNNNRIFRDVASSGVVRYEIFHDVLAAPILAWRSRFLAAQRERRRVRATFRRIVMLSVLLVASVAAAAWKERNHWVHGVAEDLVTHARDFADQHPEQAADALQQAAQRYRRLDDQDGLDTVDEVAAKILHGARGKSVAEVLRYSDAAYRAATSTRGHVAALIQKAGAQRNRPEEAKQTLKIAEELLRRDPKRPRLWLEIGRLRLSLGQWDDALTAFQNGLMDKSADDVVADAHYGIGLVYMKQSRWDEARQSLQKAWRMQQQPNQAGDAALTLSALSEVYRLSGDEHAAQESHDLADKALQNALTSGMQDER